MKYQIFKIWNYQLNLKSTIKQPSSSTFVTNPSAEIPYEFNLASVGDFHSNIEEITNAYHNKIDQSYGLGKIKTIFK